MRTLLISESNLHEVMSSDCEFVILGLFFPYFIKLCLVVSIYTVDMLCNCASPGAWDKDISKFGRMHT